MSNLIIAYDNLFDLEAGIVTATTAATKFPVANLLTDRRAARWRSTTVASTQNIRLRCGSAKALTAIAVIDHNLTSSATIQVWGSNNNFSTSTQLETLTVTAGVIVLKYRASVSYSDYELRFSDATNPAGYIEVGRIFLGDSLSFSNNYDYGWSIGPVDPSVIQKTRGGQARCDRRTKYQMARLPFSKLPRALRDSVETFINAVGTTNPFLASLDPANHLTDKTIYGRLQQLSMLTNVPVDLYSTDMTIEEWL